MSPFYLRFCAFFSLSMVLISTFTFIVSTIDELQHNEAGEVEFPLLLQVTELSTKFREILQYTKGDSTCNSVSR